MEKLILNIEAFQMSEEAFLQFCEDNRPFRFEMDKNKQLILMPPTGFETSSKNVELVFQLKLWNNLKKSGIVTESNGGFTLSNGAVRAPDVGWISNERYEAVPVAKKRAFIHACPDFVIELMSDSDNLEDSQEKMVEWRENGCRLGWLINPKTKEIWVYREDGQVTKRKAEKKITGEEVLLDFELDTSFL